MEETNVIELNGNALDNDCDVLCHQVNLDGVMGGGIAYQIACRFPDVEKKYMESEKKLGTVCFADAGSYAVANCYSQNYDFTTNYDALKSCVNLVAEYLKENNLKSVAIPHKYGCGIASGDWSTVEKIFRDGLKGYVLKIYRLT